MDAKVVVVGGKRKKTKILVTEVSSCFTLYRDKDGRHLIECPYARDGGGNLYCAHPKRKGIKGLPWCKKNGFRKDCPI